MNLIYIDCISGVAGDMLVGALIDAGASRDSVRTHLAALGIEGLDITVNEVTRGGLRALKTTVIAPKDEGHRAYPDVARIVTEAPLPVKVKERSLRTFELLAIAEASVHGRAVEEVEFHEVGSWDAIADVVAAAAALESLNPSKVVCSSLVTGRGFVDGAHGRLPVPAPAVMAILAHVGAPLAWRGDRELVTPTGAAFVAAIADEFGDMPAARIHAVGYGAGDAELEEPNVLRVLVGEPLIAEAHDASVIETNIDDMSPELIPHVVDGLLERGALDAWVTPIVMKKGRPAYTLSALAPPALVGELSRLIFRETSTLGVRIHPVRRTTLDRRVIEVQVAGHPVRVKLGIMDDEVVTAAPEYDDAIIVARATGMPLKEVYARATESVTSA